MKKERSEFTKDWIIENSIEIVSRYEIGTLTIRGLHYQLVSIGMTNDISHYKKVVNAMIEARWNNDIHFETFSDLDRVMIGETHYKETDVYEAIDEAKDSIHAWMNYYSKNRWERQAYYPEVLIEKKALQGVFGPICKSKKVTLGACKGYPSLTFLYEASLRYKKAEDNGHTPIILYFGDYDPSGEDIPRSIKENLRKFGVDVEVRRIALMEEQVVEMNLPPAPTKETDTRSGNWNGLGQVELDAVKPEVIQQMCSDAIDEIFNEDIYSNILLEEDAEREIYIRELKEYVNTL